MIFLFKIFIKIHIFELIYNTHLIITFTKELEPLSLLVHENSVEVTALHTSDFDRLVTPAHNLSRADICDARRHLAPLKNHRFGYSAIRIYVYALVIITK